MSSACFVYCAKSTNNNEAKGRDFLGRRLSILLTHFVISSATTACSISFGVRADHVSNH